MQVPYELKQSPIAGLGIFATAPIDQTRLKIFLSSTERPIASLLRNSRALSFRHRENGLAPEDLQTDLLDISQSSTASSETECAMSKFIR